MIKQQLSLRLQTNPWMRTLDRNNNCLLQSDQPSWPIKRFTYQRSLPRPTDHHSRHLSPFHSICYREAALRDIWVLQRVGAGRHERYGFMRGLKGFRDSNIHTDAIKSAAKILCSYEDINYLFWMDFGCYIMKSLLNLLKKCKRRKLPGGLQHTWTKFRVHDGSGCAAEKECLWDRWRHRSPL